MASKLTTQTVTAAVKMEGNNRKEEEEEGKKIRSVVVKPKTVMMEEGDSRLSRGRGSKVQGREKRVTSRGEKCFCLYPFLLKSIIATLINQQILLHSTIKISIDKYIYSCT